jgi:hypothetical protein
MKQFTLSCMLLLLLSMACTKKKGTVTSFDVHQRHTVK